MKLTLPRAISLAAWRDDIRVCTGSSGEGVKGYKCAGFSIVPDDRYCTGWSFCVVDVFQQLKTCIALAARNGAARCTDVYGRDQRVCHRRFLSVFTIDTSITKYSYFTYVGDNLLHISRLDCNLQCATAVHLIQCFLEVFQLENIRNHAFGPDFAAIKVCNGTREAESLGEGSNNLIMWVSNCAQ